MRADAAAMALVFLSGCSTYKSIPSEEQSNVAGYKGVTTFICGIDSDPSMRYFAPINKITGERFYVDPSNSQRRSLNREYFESSFGSENTLVKYFEAHRKGDEVVLNVDIGAKGVPSDENTIYSRKEVINLSTLVSQLEVKKVRSDYKLNAGGGFELEQESALLRCMSMPLPFSPSAEAFESFLNSPKVDWGKGKKVQFAHLDRCSENASAVNMSRVFSCEEGFVTIQTPMGKRVCELGGHSGVTAMVTILQDMSVNHKYEYKTKECSESKA